VRVACFFTGDELVTPGVPLAAGRRSTTPTALRWSGWCNGLGCELIDLGIVPDTLEATEDALPGLRREADLVITSGGVSVGEADYVKAALEKLGRVRDVEGGDEARQAAPGLRDGSGRMPTSSACPATRSRRSSPSACSFARSC
jgi:hypothetical protein